MEDAKKFKTLMDNSEESIILLQQKRLDYVNKTFLNKYKGIIETFEDNDVNQEDVNAYIEEQDKIQSNWVKRQLTRLFRSKKTVLEKIKRIKKQKWILF